MRWHRLATVCLASTAVVGADCVSKVSVVFLLRRIYPPKKARGVRAREKREKQKMSLERKLKDRNTNITLKSVIRKLEY